jgi:CBS domain-containing protein
VGGALEEASMNDAQDEYPELFDDEPIAGEDGEGESRELRDSLFNDQVSALDPSEPIALTPDTTVREAIGQMVAKRRAGVVAVDEQGRLVGIFTERDVLTRVVAAGLDVDATTLGAVMTPNPEALRPADRICYAVHCMSVAGYRTIPLIDEQYRPTGIISVNDVLRWLAGMFPGEVLNLRPGDRLRHPEQIDAG